MWRGANNLRTGWKGAILHLDLSGLKLLTTLTPLHYFYGERLRTETVHTPLCGSLAQWPSENH